MRAILAAASIPLLAACQLGPRPVAGPLPSGEWAVVGARAGDAPVRDPRAAVAAHGLVVRFAPDHAVSGNETCRKPRYLASLMVADPYLRYELGLRHSDLGLDRWQDVRITEVYCEGRKWRAIGGEVLWVDSGLGYAVRDAVVYELRPTGTR